MDPGMHGSLLFLCIFVAALQSSAPPRSGHLSQPQQTSGGRQPHSIALGMDENQIYCQSKEFSWLNFSTLTFSFFPIKDLNNSIEDEDVYDEIFDQCCTPDGLAVKCHLSFTTSLITFLKKIFTRWSFQNFQFFWIMKHFGRDDVSKIYLDKLLANRRWRIVKLNCLFDWW